MNILYHSPGQLVTVLLETLNPDGYRADGYAVPSVNRIIFPSLANASSYPQNMVKIGEGLYRHSFTLPTGASAVGSYVVDIKYQLPDDPTIKSSFVQVVVTAPAGNYSISSG
jgi:hypothetical protein